MGSKSDNTVNHPLISTIDVMRPTHVEIRLDRMRTNFLKVKKHVHPARIMVVLKANAYGHGLVRVARLMQELGADYIGVAVCEEGILLREMGITMPILVLGGILGNQIPHFLKHNLTITAASMDILQQIDQVAEGLDSKAKVHLKIDTGMERIGVHYYNTEPFLEAAAQARNIEIEGIFSHFANAQSTDLTHARLQLQRFRDVLSFYDRRGLAPPPLKHMANSGAILQLPEAKFDMVRPGGLIYGIYPAADLPKNIDVTPVLSWKSRVVYFKVIRPGHPVGYGSTWVSDRPTRAVTIPVGYGDGYLRALSNKAEVIIHGKRYPVIGQISMDQIVINIDQDSAYAGDEVVLLGTMGKSSVYSEDLAAWAGTIAYEILTNINTRVPRLYVE